MKKVTYLNTFGDECTRHGWIRKQNGTYIFNPNDTTKIIEIKKKDLIKIENAKK